MKKCSHPFVECLVDIGFKVQFGWHQFKSSVWRINDKEHINYCLIGFSSVIYLFVFLALFFYGLSQVRPSSTCLVPRWPCFFLEEHWEK